MSISRRYFCQGAYCAIAVGSLPMAGFAAPAVMSTQSAQNLTPSLFDLSGLQRESVSFDQTLYVHQWHHNGLSLVLDADQSCTLLRHQITLHKFDPADFTLGYAQEQIRLHLGEVVCEEVVQQLYWLGAAG